MKRSLVIAICLLLWSTITPAHAWDAKSRDDVGGKAAWRGNTHLFIVERAIDLLEQSDDPFALGAARYLNACTASWRQGLWDADARSELVDEDNLGSHFYDPSPPDSCHTFKGVFGGCQDGAFDARRNAKHQIAHFSTGKSAVSPGTYGHHGGSRCYALGLALHYMTDVTMPYHAARYSGMSLPLMLHPTLEGYTPVIQHRFVEKSWTPAPGSPDDRFLIAAKEAKGLFGKLQKAVLNSSEHCLYSSEPWVAYSGPCYRNRADVDAAIGEALRRAQQNTASYLRAVFQANPSLIPPGPPLFAAIWAEQAGPGFVARHQLTSQEYQQEFDKLGKQGLCLVEVSGYEQSGQARYAAIWEQKGCPLSVARHGLTAQEYQQEFDKLGKQGFRLKLVNGYTVGGQDRYAAIWEKSPGPALIARHGLTAAEYQQAFDDHAKQGFCLSHVSGYALGDQDRYAAIWEKKPCPAFVARHGLTSQQYQQEFDKLVKQGYRLKLVSGHQRIGIPIYAAIWQKSAGPLFEAHHGMTSQQYQKAFDDLGKRGFRLIWVDGT